MAAGVVEREPIGPLALAAALAGTGRVTRDDTSWTGLVEAAAWHGLRPALHHALASRSVLDSLPTALRRALNDAARLEGLRVEARRQQLREALDALAAAGVRCIVLKGAHLAEHVYPAELVRPMVDLDLLVAPRDAAAAHAALAALGYAPATNVAAPPRHWPTLVRAHGLPVELHRAIEPCEAPFTLALDGVWARARPATIAGVPTLVLAPEDLLLHLALHMAHSHLLGASLVGVLDVRACVCRWGSSLDWERVTAHARAARAERFVHAALALARRVADAPVPPGILGSLRTPGSEAAVERALELLASPPFVLVGARAVARADVPLAVRLARVLRALLVTPAREQLGPRLADQIGRADRTPARDGYVARWSSVARLLLHPDARRAAVRQVRNVRAQRRWAEGGG